jgi:hypothetical protein
MSAAQDAEQKAATARGEAQKAQDRGGAVAQEAKQAQTDSTNLDAFRSKEAAKAKAGEASGGGSGAGMGGAGKPSSAAADKQESGPGADKTAASAPAESKEEPPKATQGAGSAMAGAASPAGITPTKPKSPEPPVGATPTATPVEPAVASLPQANPAEGIAATASAVSQSSKSAKGLFDQLKDLAATVSAGGSAKGGPSPKTASEENVRSSPVDGVSAKS